MGNTFGSAIEQAARFQKALEEIRAIEDWRVDRAVKIAIEALSIQDHSKIEAETPATDSRLTTRETEERVDSPLGNAHPSTIPASKDHQHQINNRGDACAVCGVAYESWSTQTDNAKAEIWFLRQQLADAERRLAETTPAAVQAGLQEASEAFHITHADAQLAGKQGFRRGAEWQLAKDRAVMKELDGALANLYAKWKPADTARPGGKADG